MVVDSSCHASSFETSRGDTNSNSTPSISSVAPPAASTFWTQSEAGPYIKMSQTRHRTHRAHNRHYVFLVVPGHGPLVTRLTGYLTLD